MIGLSRFRQSLSGSLKLPDDATERPLAVELRGVRPALVPGLGGAVEVEGRIAARGIAEDQPVRGVVRFRRLTPLAAGYSLSFRSDDGRPLELTAERRANWSELVFSASRVTGQIVDADGRLVASFELRLDFRRDLSRWVPS
jgi:hypothetical protein